MAAASASRVGADRIPRLSATADDAKPAHWQQRMETLLRSLDLFGVVANAVASGPLEERARSKGRTALEGKDVSLERVLFFLSMDEDEDVAAEAKAALLAQEALKTSKPSGSGGVKKEGAGDAAKSTDKKDAAAAEAAGKSSKIDKSMLSETRKRLVKHSLQAYELLLAGLDEQELVGQLLKAVAKLSDALSWTLRDVLVFLLPFQLQMTLTEAIDEHSSRVIPVQLALDDVRLDPEVVVRALHACAAKYDGPVIFRDARRGQYVLEFANELVYACVLGGRVPFRQVGRDIDLLVD